MSTAQGKFTKEQADELGKQEKAGGKNEVTGGDLSDSDARIYGLRKAGYDGWVDRDGHPSGSRGW